jgi:methylmalonyl-CoA mutase, N-terminal domain
MDEAYCTPTEAAVKVALRTQQIIAHETGIGDTIDPMGGSYFLESLTDTIEERAMEELDKIEKMGGAAKAIENSYFRRQIDVSAYKLQRRVDSGEQKIVGVNAFKEAEETPMEIFTPPAEAQERQITKLNRLKKRRDGVRVKEALEQVARVAASNENTVPALVEAVDAYATLGEICSTLRGVLGDYEESGF